MRSNAGDVMDAKSTLERKTRKGRKRQGRIRGEASSPPRRYVVSRFLPAAALALMASGCTVRLPHSILDPAGPQAAHIARLWWQMFTVYGLVFVVTLLLLVVALIKRRRDRPALGSGFVIVAGIIIPTVILVIMLISDIRVHKHFAEQREDFQVQVIGHMWWFAVRYPDHGIVDANEIHVPAGKVVRYELFSKGMIHSFWVPRLGGKRDQLPDHPNELRLEASEPGVYEGTCTEYCAGQHARMGFRLVAHAPDDFEQWLLQRQQPPPVPSDPRLLRGREVFMDAGCGTCHAINGLSQADTGPDLTYVGARRTLGAGEFANTIGEMSGWIANSQALKPGNLMPRTYLPPEDLHTLVDYLRSLR
jgi:cytochrome c oxidase subunit II